MDLFSIAETILIGPLMMLYELIFVFSNKLFDNVGFSIIALSLTVNFLVLPLYDRADAIQKKARDTENALRKGVRHIKKTFSGDEKMMILQTYYRQNNYKPADAFKGSVSLLLEIPFFIAAYMFISGERSLENVSFGPIRDFSQPDGILVIGGIAVNILPIIMTLLNVISAMIYTKDFPLKTKIQTYGLAAFFLIFLYGSPSGLAFYWALNNLFSLVKNIFYVKIKGKSQNTPKIIWSVILLLFAAYITYLSATGAFEKKQRTIIITGIVLVSVFISSVIWERIPLKKYSIENNRGLLIACAMFMTILTGGLIPSAMVAASPQEYIFSFSDFSPMWYIVNNFCLAAGLFLIWIPVFYGLASERVKYIIQIAAAMICTASVINYLFFGTGLGLLSADLIY